MNKYSIYIFSLVLISLFNLISSQSSPFDKIAPYTQTSCLSKGTCKDCIQTPGCAWCAQEDFGDKPRCFQPDSKPAQLCDEAFTVDPGNELAIKRAAALSRAGKFVGGGSMYEEEYSSSSSSHSSSSSGYKGSSSSSGHGDVVQISPQHVNLKLRVNQKHSFSVNYAQAEDYPVDLYYLMDLSKSMEDDKEKLSHLGDLLSDTMRNITSNFRLGFGSFVDKVLMPYVSTVPKKLEHPCDQCEAPYGYKNHMKLDTDTRKFSKNVKDAHVSGNLDAPEGGFDAIMQAIVCEREIGWREQARRLLVFSTDAGFHYAGDGKLGGVITPNDGKCHMSNNQYTHSSIQDYPSISQINLKVKEHKINLIFAVTEQEHHVYQELSKHVEGSTSAVLSNDSSNIVDLVRDEYNKISSSVEMKDSASGAVKVAYYSKCLGNERKLTNKCDGLKVGDVVSFDVEVMVTSCPEDPRDYRQQFKIYPVGVGEALIVDLEMLCSCDCESAGPTFQINSPKCNGQGTLKCGICECYDRFYGNSCECSASGTGTDIDKDYLKCFANNSTDEAECSGRGSCVCGQCHCFPRENPDESITGKFCECDNFSCDRHEGLLCSGPDHGTCQCGKCACEPGWGGNACECSTSTDMCKAPTDEGDTVCSGHGSCVCGRCECNTENGTRYHGKFCDRCPTCKNKCDELKDCVECQAYNKGPLKDKPDECVKCSFVPIEVEDVEYDEDKLEHFCLKYDEDDCRYRFVYNETIENGVVKYSVRTQKPQECPAKVFLLGIILGVIAAIVLIGLAMLLLWKLLTTIHDRREFARFEKERMMAKWDTGENPIYKQATSTFKNPTYAGK